MLQKMKQLLVIGIAAVSLAFAGVSIADACPQPPCDPDVVAQAHADATLYNPAVIQPGVMGSGSAGGKDLVLSADARASGQDSYKRILWFRIKIPGYAYASATATMTPTVKLFIKSTGEQHSTGLASVTLVKAVGILDYSATGFATGNDGCLQQARAALSGKFGAQAAGYAYATGPNGTFSFTDGEGHTVVAVRAFDSESDSDGWFIFDPVAVAHVGGKIIVKQGLFAKAYVSADGTTTRNLGIITGGEALSLGDADIVGIKAAGQVSQMAGAAGLGASASGNSFAAYQNAGGSTYNGCISAANANGLAIVTGYNNITHNGNTLTVTSHQTAFATTGNTGFGGSPQ